MIGLFAVIAGLGCAPAPDSPGPFHALFARIDDNHDGIVSKGEFTPRAPHGPPYTEVDRNHDGYLVEREFASRIFSADPTHFEDALDPANAPVANSHQPTRGGPGTSGPAGEHARVVRELFLVLREEILARRPDLVLPDEAAIEAASQGGDLASPACVTVRHALAEGAVAAGLALPDRLRALLEG